MALIELAKSWLSGNAFKGQGIVFKLLRFLHLMENDAVVFSLTGAQLWATTILNIHTQIVSHDHILMGMTMGSNAIAMGAHAVKRSQLINTNSDDTPDEPDPPWKGEAD